MNPEQSKPVDGLEPPQTYGTPSTDCAMPTMPLFAGMLTVAVAAPEVDPELAHRVNDLLLPLVKGLIEPPEEASDDGGDGELVRLVAPADRLVGDGETLLLYKERLLRLGPLGAEIVDLAVRPIAVGALADRLTERLGAPDGVDARAATADAVERLIADGVLERVDSCPL